MPVRSAAKLSGMPKTRLNMFSVLTESRTKAGSSSVDVRIATARNPAESPSNATEKTMCAVRTVCRILRGNRRRVRRERSSSAGGATDGRVATALGWFMVFLPDQLLGHPHRVHQAIDPMNAAVNGRYPI